MAKLQNLFYTLFLFYEKCNKMLKKIPKFGGFIYNT